MEKWNKRNLQSSVVKTWVVKKNRFDVNHLISVLNRIKKDCESLKLLHVEASILSRLIYRMKSKFRHDKGLKMMEKVNRALLNYLDINFANVLDNFKGCINVEEDFVTLPSRQMLQYLLIKIQGFAKLMCRTEQVAMYAAHMLKSRISLGHAWTVSKVGYAVISRIWLLLRNIITKSCNWYDELYKFVPKFEIVGRPWISEDYEFPKNLKLWLNLTWNEEELAKISFQNNVLQSFLNTVTEIESDEANEDFSSELEKSNIIDEEEEKESTSDVITETIVDFGTSIKRDEFESKVKTPVAIKRIKRSKKQKNEKIKGLKKKRRLS